MLYRVQQLEKQTEFIAEFEVQLAPMTERLDGLQTVFTKIRDLDTRLTEVRRRYNANPSRPLFPLPRRLGLGMLGLRLGFGS